MSKQIKALIVLQVTDDFDPDTLVVRDHDVIDGFELTRDDPDDDITDEFKLEDAYIEKVGELPDDNLSPRERKALEYLKSVLLQNDEKDELQLEIMNFIQENYENEVR